MPRIGHIILNASNFEVSEGFYDRILLRLGFAVDFREVGPKWSGKSYKLNEHNLWIKSESSQVSQPFVRNVGLDHLAFFVDSREDVDDIHADLKESNCYVTRAPADYPEYAAQYYAFYFRDPDEIPLEIAFKQD